MSELATWWTQGTPGVNYVRAELPARHLPGRTIALEQFHLVPGALRLSRQVGTAVWLFPGNVTRWKLMAELHDQGIPVWADVDDNYTMVSPTPTKRWLALRDRSGDDESSVEVHRRIIRSLSVDGLIVATPALRDAYRFMHRNVHVCRNCVDPDDWPADPPHSPDGVLRVGWAGSASHSYDLNDLRRALDWASRQPDVEVVLIGELLFEGIPCTHIPWSASLAEFRRSIETIDVMLCPVRENDWSRCKSDLKVLEAAMAGACAVVSRAEPYRSWWENGAPCYVAQDAKDFLKAVKHLVANRDEARETARLAREHVLAERSISVGIQSWREALT